MKHLLPLLLLATTTLLSLAGCGANSNACYQTVVHQYPGAQIVQVVGEPFRFVVKRADGAILCVQTMDIFDTGISAEQVVFPAPSK